ncbi:SDR family NAD(P)-dependent oxidoreductase [Sphingobacterium siyangense]|uniref:SDR family NAD(P)-dependent oxidoreductase n=1 Tax=Sphingobacterium siyangense TaxID=459529 RepID=UPI001965016A|nr:SDR family oxidoreductase [Sphingobacterium siyangense]QRY55491.1 SDR family oxidoreductase [Sphingobacterium siyangense]
MDMQQTVLITGATSGIGLELAKLFAADGYRLVIVARDVMDLAATASLLRDTYSASVEVFAKDLFDPESGFELYRDLKESGIIVDVLVNNAGQGQYGLFIDTDIRRQLDIIQLNISSLVVLTHLFLKDMVAAGSGKILNLSSIASKAPGPWQAVYHGTKAFVQSFTEAIRSEVKDTGITVTALLPGVTDTDFFNKADMTRSKAVQDKDDMADPAEVAKDGYDALMRGDDKVISGFKNKVQVALNNLIPDQNAADQMKDFQEPVDEDKDSIQD